MAVKDKRLPSVDCYVWVLRNFLTDWIGLKIVIRV